MLQKQPSPMIVSRSRKRLQILYAHRKAIETLIHSLEQYDRMRAKSIEFQKPKSA